VEGLHAAPGRARHTEAGRMVGDDAAGFLHGSVTDSQRSQHRDRWVKVGSVREIDEREDVKSSVIAAAPSSFIARRMASTTRLRRRSRCLFGIILAEPRSARYARGGPGREPRSVILITAPMGQNTVENTVRGSCSVSITLYCCRKPQAMRTKKCSTFNLKTIRKNTHRTSRLLIS
jgi:hypothetical protein